HLAGQAVVERLLLLHRSAEQLGDAPVPRRVEHREERAARGLGLEHGERGVGVLAPLLRGLGLATPRLAHAAGALSPLLPRLGRLSTVVADRTRPPHAQGDPRPPRLDPAPLLDRALALARLAVDQRAGHAVEVFHGADLAVPRELEVDARHLPIVGYLEIGP